MLRLLCVRRERAARSIFAYVFTLAYQKVSRLLLLGCRLCRIERVFFSGRKQSALSASFLQQAAAEGAAVAAGTPPGRMLNLHGMELSSSLRYLRRRLREYLGVCAANDVAVTMYDVGGRRFLPH